MCEDKYPAYNKKYPKKFIQALKKEFGSDQRMIGFVEELKKGRTGSKFEKEIAEHLGQLARSGLDLEISKYTEKRQQKRKKLIEKWERLRDDILLESRDERCRFLRYFEYIAHKYFSAKSSFEYSPLESQYYSKCLCTVNNEILCLFNTLSLENKLKELERMRKELGDIFKIKTEDYKKF